MLTAALLLVTGHSAAWAQSDRAYVLYRQHIMQALGANLNAISDIFRFRLPYNADIRVHAASLAGNAAMVRASFEKQVVNPQSTVKAELWTHWAEFVRLSDELQSASAALAAAAAAGDANQIGIQVKAVGATCKACHDRFRAQEEPRRRR